MSNASFTGTYTPLASITTGGVLFGMTFRIMCLDPDISRTGTATIFKLHPAMLNGKGDFSTWLSTSAAAQMSVCQVVNLSDDKEVILNLAPEAITTEYSSLASSAANRTLIKRNWPYHLFADAATDTFGFLPNSAAVIYRYASQPCYIVLIDGAPASTKWSIVAHTFGGYFAGNATTGGYNPSVNRPSVHIGVGRRAINAIEHDVGVALNDAEKVVGVVASGAELVGKGLSYVPAIGTAGTLLADGAAAVGWLDREAEKLTH